MRRVNNEQYSRMVKSLAQAITVAEVGRLTVRRYTDVRWRSVNGLLQQTNIVWNIIPADWYELPAGEYPTFYPYWERKLTIFIANTLIRNQMSPLDFVVFWGLPSVARGKRLEEYVMRYGASELERRRRLFIQRGLANQVTDPERDWVTKFVAPSTTLI